MRRLIDYVLRNYGDFYLNSEKPSDHEVANVITKLIPEKLISELNLDTTQFKVLGSYGMGNLTQTPWVSIFNKRITESAQKGFYIVYLFKKDMSGVYISLNQGTTYLQEKFKGRKPREKMKDVAQSLKEELFFPSISHTEEEISLESKTSNAKNYEAANIYSKFYEINDLPEEDILFKDLRKFLEGLLEIKEFIGNRSLDGVIDDLIYKEEVIDTKFQEDINVTEPSYTEEVPQDVPDKDTNHLKGTWRRNPAVAKEAIIKANYSCEVDEDHVTFISSTTDKNFVEAHHLIPINNQESYKYSLDVPGNIVSLCPNCHRRIHHATSSEKKVMLKALFKKREIALKQFGLKIDLNSLLKSYDV